MSIKQISDISSSNTGIDEQVIINRRTNRTLVSIVVTVLNEIEVLPSNFNKKLHYTKKTHPVSAKQNRTATKGKLKVVIVSRASFKSGIEGGADRYAFTLAKILSKVTDKIELYFVGRNSELLNQFQVTLVEVANKRGIESSREGVSYFFNGFILNISSAITAIKFLKKEKDVQIVNTNSNISTILIRLSRFGRNIKIIYTIHDNLYSSLEKPIWWQVPIRLLNNFILERIAIRISDNIIAVSPVIINQIPNKYKHKSNLVFPPGIDFPEYIDTYRYQEIAQEFAMLPKKYGIVAGYLNDRKRVDIIIKSWKFVPEPISLVVVGYGPNYDKLRMLSHNLGLSGRIFFTGKISDDHLFYLLNNSLFGIIASDREGFPTFIVECLKIGSPVIFFISNGENVYKNVAGKYLYVKKLVDPLQMSNDIKQFITETIPVNRDAVKEWAFNIFGIKDRNQIIKDLFVTEPE